MRKSCTAAALLALGLPACKSDPTLEPYTPWDVDSEDRPIGYVIATLERDLVTWNSLKLGATDDETRARMRGFELVLARESRKYRDELLLQLDVGTPRNRRVSAAALGFAGDPRALDPLLRALEDEDTAVADNALVGLGLLSRPAGPRDPPIYPPLEPLLSILEQAQDPARRTNAAYAVKRAVEAGARADGAVPALLRSLRDPEPGVRVQVAAALGVLGGEGTARELRLALADGDPVVRASAAFSLGRMGATEARPDLERLLGAKEPGVREAARAALTLLNARPPSAPQSP
jgi:HEAT repeat protein